MVEGEEQIVRENAERDTTGPDALSAAGSPEAVPSGAGDMRPVTRLRHAAAGTLEETARRVRQAGEQAAQRGGIARRTEPIARSAASGIDSAAQYVRTRNPAEMREDFEVAVSRNPLKAVAIAFVAGYLARRIF